VHSVRTDAVLGCAAQLIVLGVLADTVGLSPPAWLVGVTCSLVTNMALAHVLVRSGATTLGPASRVTLARATLIGGVAAMVTDAFVRPVSVPTLLTLTVVALVLDGVDGWVARRTDTTSAVGASFDMEADAFLILTLSVYVSRSVGPWVLAIGAARYAFLVAGWFLPWVRAPLPPRFWRKTVAAIQSIVLTTAAADLLPVVVTIIALVSALVLLAESFGRDAGWLWRHRPARQVARGRTMTAERPALVGSRPH
jgi:phosphatidylglycerophosphate synthase